MDKREAKIDHEKFAEANVRLKIWAQLQVLKNNGNPTAAAMLPIVDEVLADLWFTNAADAGDDCLILTGTADDVPCYASAGGGRLAIVPKDLGPNDLTVEYDDPS